MIHPHILGLDGRTFCRSMISSRFVAAVFIRAFPSSNIHKSKLLAATSIPANITIPAPSRKICRTKHTTGKINGCCWFFEKGVVCFYEVNHSSLRYSQCEGGHEEEIPPVLSRHKHFSQGSITTKFWLRKSYTQGSKNFRLLCAQLHLTSHIFHVA